MINLTTVNGSGKEILQKVYDKYADGNTVVIGCGPYARVVLVAHLVFMKQIGLLD